MISGESNLRLLIFVLAKAHCSSRPRRMASAVVSKFRAASPALAEFFAKRPHLMQGEGLVDLGKLKAENPAVASLADQIERALSEIDTRPKGFPVDVYKESMAEPDWDSLKSDTEAVLPGFTDAFKQIYQEGVKSKALEDDFDEDYDKFRKPLEDQLVHIVRSFLRCLILPPDFFHDRSFRIIVMYMHLL